MTASTGPLVGPGSQPADEDGTVLDYMQMPSGMSTFSTPNLPEAEDIRGRAGALDALERVLAILQGWEADGPGHSVDVTGLGASDIDLVNQVLGEGEVSAIGGARIQAQESVLAGVWRVRLTDDGGTLVRDMIEVARFPSMILASVFSAARVQLDIPDSFGPNIFNAPPLLPEINEHVAKSGAEVPPHVINLSLLPHTEEDLGFLNEILGRGPATILSRGYGNCRITATATRNTWWVQYYNSQDALILNTIEISPIPEVACAAREDISDSAERLNEILEIYR
ncbi:MAG: hydrogenase expression/formation protein [Rhodobiaceae bacterium]|nr:hydrogenase expression/formation protein [Paracoccaceae bacterium]MCB1473218.1 hydrogenase expression/formation protein [Rhodobiaceae bacterium]